MKKKSTIILLVALLSGINAIYGQQGRLLNTQSPSFTPLHEMRAVWLTTIGGLDWPHHYSQSSASAEKQKEELTVILDQLASAGINTVLLQTRVRATTIFPSEKEPWDGCLSGKPGESPGYDALEFAVEECHKRGMKLHAWIVCIPIGKWDGAGCRNLRKTQASLVKKIGDEGFMNPEANGTADYLANFCEDITERYDIDGIHLDYIRYPETWKVIKNKDVARDNITTIVRRIHSKVKEKKPWVMMSCSPVGKYADTRRANSRGWNAKDAVCQDVALWMKEGLMDCIFPMMYFKDKNFYPFVIDWAERSEGKLVVPGLGIYMMSPKEKNWSLEDITREMNVARQYGMGSCFFRSKFFTDNTKGIYDYTRSTFSPQPSLQPVMYEGEKPAKPSSIEVKENGEEIIIAWERSWNGEGEELQYNLYGSEKPTVDITDGRNLLANNLTRNEITLPKSETIRYFAVTATDRYGNESEPLQSYKEEPDNASQREITTLNFPYDGKRVLLTSADLTAGQLITITSLEGNDLTSCFTKREGSHFYIDTYDLKPSHYILYLTNKKGYRHRIGFFSVPISKEGESHE